MRKFPAVLIFILYYSFPFIKQVNSGLSFSTEGTQQPRSSVTVQEYPPFMVLYDEEDPLIPLPENYILPSKYTQIGEKLSLAADKPNLPETALCPELRTENETLRKALRSLKRNEPEIEDCLFVAEFPEGEKQTCMKEPKRRLTAARDLEGKEVICGITEKQQLVSAKYNNCGTVKYFEGYQAAVSVATASDTQDKPHLLPQVYEIYEICYDFQNKKTLWTKHNILTPELLTHKEYPHKNLNTVNLDEFETETFSRAVTEQTFTDMKHKFELADTNMLIYPLVPRDHMALWYWKKSTNHMINSAPIFPEFIPLMKAIHNGILLASNYVLREFHETLTIYTKAETILSDKHGVFAALYSTSAIEYLMPELSNDVFRPNTWYVIVHNENSNSAVLIVLHNTEEDPPTNKECSDTVQLPCNFKNWSEDPHSITQSSLEHAYCCSVRSDTVRELFSINNLEIQKDFNIEEMIRLEQDEQSK